MSKLKIFILNGSPKAASGNTYVMTEAFSAGAKSNGATVENIFLAKYNIQHCLGCFKCWKETPGKCILQDDAEMLMNKIAKANVLIFATPLYVDNVSGILKNFMDRMIMKACPNVEKDEMGETRHVVKNKQQLKIGAISNCGFPEQSQFQVLRLYFRRVARNMKAKLIVEIYRGEGPLLSAKAEQLKPIIDNYKHLLKEAGKAVVTKGTLSAELIEKLEKPLIPYDIYRENINNTFNHKN
jgi:multimeric flavodoxin WrbA